MSTSRLASGSEGSGNNLKRTRRSSHEAADTVKPPSPAHSASGGGNGPAAPTFRNVSACNRCRLRKNRCDQRLPSCTLCEKAGVKCVGYDPATKKEIPRSYVFYLENRVSYLESLLLTNGISFAPAENFAVSLSGDDQHALGGEAVRQPAADGSRAQPGAAAYGESEKLEKLVSSIGMVSVQGTSDSRFLGSTSGISFARVVFAAVKSSVSGAASERSGVKPSKPQPIGASSTGMRDSFFGLQTRPVIKQAPFPEKELALKLVGLYFEHANPQIPILHRSDFMAMFEKAYAVDEREHSSRELYMLNIVFAIGSGILVGADPNTEEGKAEVDQLAGLPLSETPPRSKRRKLSIHQHQPEEYHASAIVHLESFLGSSGTADRPDGFGGGLEELQAVLLLADYALLRPVAPGLWYIVGVAVRLAVDLGLHYEDGTSVSGGQVERTSLSTSNNSSQSLPVGQTIDAREVGRRQWVRDLRRRLWWCVYSFDRLVSVCVGRPFGITDSVVTTEFPSLLDDKFITAAGFRTPPGESEKPSYKFVSHHYFRLRLLQSEILQVLQYGQAQQARATHGTHPGNEYMHTGLSSPFLKNFHSFQDWRYDIDKRLLEWKNDAPTQQDTGVQFQPLFLELNYWQAIVLLYRSSLAIPPILASEMDTMTEEVESPTMVQHERLEDEDRVFLKVAEAGQNVLKIYRKLHRLFLVNYTYLATHHLFMAGISFLYAIWHSPAVRSSLVSENELSLIDSKLTYFTTVDDFDFTVLAATSVLGDLTVQCPPAESCRDAFERMSRATIHMVLSTTGFGAQAVNKAKGGPNGRGTDHQNVAVGSTSGIAISNNQFSEGDVPTQPQVVRSQMGQPRFDMNLQDLFADDEMAFKHFNRPSMNVTIAAQPQLTATPIGQPASNSGRGSALPPPLGDTNPQALDPAFQQGAQPGLAATGAFADLDWLDMFPEGPGAAANSYPTGSGETAADGTGELDLGFGMDWDGANHDWADGSSLDLFDGFFFGNS